MKVASKSKSPSIGTSHVASAAGAGSSEPHGGHSDERVMVIAPVGGDASAIAALLNERGFQCCVCAEPQHVIDEIGNTAALVMTEEALAFPSASMLIAALQDQPPWSELPLDRKTTRPNS